MSYVVANKNIRELTARKSSGRDIGNNAINNDMKNVTLESSVENFSLPRPKRNCNYRPFSVCLDTP